MNVRMKLVVAFLVVWAAGCVSVPSKSVDTNPFTAEGVRTKAFVAHTIFYNTSPAPLVTEKTFRSMVEINIRADVRSYRFSNFIEGGETPDAVVTLAVSGRAAGLMIYDGAGNSLAQYPKGTAVSGAVFFKNIGEKSVTHIRWFIGPDSIVSVIESVGLDGRLGYFEVTLYKAV